MELGIRSILFLLIVCRRHSSKSANSLRTRRFLSSESARRLSFTGCCLDTVFSVCLLGIEIAPQIGIGLCRLRMIFHARQCRSEKLKMSLPAATVTN